MSSMDRHDVNEALLMDYAAGSLAEPVALAVASHVSLNQAAQAAYADFNRVGGLMLDDLEPEEMDDDALDAVLDRLDEMAVSVPAPKLDAETQELIPAPLQPYLAASLTDLPWRRIGLGVEEYRVPVPGDTHRVSLLRIRPGRAMPRHTHRGPEYTVVLDGSYTDGDRVLGRGDLDYEDVADHHQPVADKDTGCLCLIVLDAPVKLTGMVGRLINPFLRN